MDGQTCAVNERETEAPDGVLVSTSDARCEVHIIHKSSLFYWFGSLFYATCKFASQSQITRPVPVSSLLLLYSMGPSHGYLREGC
jgi:hypothetical protein